MCMSRSNDTWIWCLFSAKIDVSLFLFEDLIGIYCMWMLIQILWGTNIVSHVSFYRIERCCLFMYMFHYFAHILLKLMSISSQIYTTQNNLKWQVLPLNVLYNTTSGWKMRRIIWSYASTRSINLSPVSCLIIPFRKKYHTQCLHWNPHFLLRFLEMATSDYTTKSNIYI